MKDFEVVKQIGSGSFKKVFLAIEKETGFHVALSSIDLDDLKKGNAQETIVNEVSIQSKLSHPNIIQLYGTFYENNQFYMIQEYVTGGNLL